MNFVQVKKVKPHVLLGLSGVGGVFNEEVGKPFSWLCHFFVLHSYFPACYLGRKRYLDSM